MTRRFAPRRGYKILIRMEEYGNHDFGGPGNRTIVQIDRQLFILTTVRLCVVKRPQPVPIMKGPAAILCFAGPRFLQEIDPLTDDGSKVQHASRARVAVGVNAGVVAGGRRSNPHVTAT